MRISAHAVRTAIRDAIVGGSFPPGTRLAEELLARRYGVSRVPVREALRALESEGFVVTRRHAGAFVAEPGEHEWADLVDAAALLEPLAAARAAKRRSQAHLKNSGTPRKRRNSPVRASTKSACEKLET